MTASEENDAETDAARDVSPAWVTAWSDSHGVAAPAAVDEHLPIDSKADPRYGSPLDWVTAWADRLATPSQQPEQPASPSMSSSMSAHRSSGDFDLAQPKAEHARGREPEVVGTSGLCLWA